MHRRAATAALIVLVWTLISPGLLLARPTRKLARPPARLVTPEPGRRSHGERTTHNSGARAPRPVSRLSSHARADRTVLAAERSSHRKASSRDFLEAASIPSADTDAIRRVRAWERSQQAMAAHDAILAADRATSASARFPSDGAATGDEASVDPDLSSASPAIKSIEQEVSRPLLKSPLPVASLFDTRGRLIVPKPLYGSREILLHQNQMADYDGLDRVQDDAGLLDLLREKKLVALPTNEGLQVDERLPENRRYSRPWTATFLAALARDYYASFHSPLQITSAIRTVAVQERLLRTNGNAASAAGEEASPHLTGQAVDIAKHGLSLTQIAWMRTYLGPLIDQGKIDVEEEFQQACFHISVYRSYLPGVPHVAVASTRQLSTESLSERPSY